MGRPKIPTETRILAALKRGPLPRARLCDRVQVYPVARMDAVLLPLVDSGVVAVAERPGRKGRAAKVYSLVGNTETAP